MKRTVISAFLAIAALAMLAALVVRSRSLPLNVHIAQNTIGTSLKRASEDFGTLVKSLQSAWANNQVPGDGAEALNERLAKTPGQLSPLVAEIPGSVSQRSRLANSLHGFSQAVSTATGLASTLMSEQAAYIASLDYVRTEGPQIIQKMRESDLNDQAGSAFQLVIGTLDFATPNASVSAATLRQLLAKSVGADSAQKALPNLAAHLGEAVTNVLDNKPGIQSQLTQLARVPIVNQASNLQYATEALYRSTVSSHEQARAMLSIYAVALLLVVGFIAFRLQGSYREINRANGELADLNSSLEHRVAQRTDELSGALTNLKESQVQLVQAEKMSSLGQLVAGISHEINTPLLYLSNNSVLIQERVEVMQQFVKRCAKAFALAPTQFEDRAEFQQQLSQSLKEMKHFLVHNELEATVEEAGDLTRDSIDGLSDLTDMAQSLKDFSRLDRAPVGQFSVNSGLDKTLVIARNVIKHKAEVRKDYGEVPEIACSPSQINQVFLNLVTNAAQAIPEYGTITLSTHQYDAEHVAISVIDTGTGIPPDILDKIRDPFFTTKEVGTGTGLGLSIVDEIIRTHGGELRIESEIGKGSTFTVILPIKQPETGESAGAAPSNESTATPATRHEQDALAEAS